MWGFWMGVGVPQTKSREHCPLTFAHWLGSGVTVPPMPREVIRFILAPVVFPWRVAGDFSYSPDSRSSQ